MFYFNIVYIGLHKENKLVYTIQYVIGMKKYYRRNVFIPRTIVLLISLFAYIMKGINLYCSLIIRLYSIYVIIMEIDINLYLYNALNLISK